MSHIKLPSFCCTTLININQDWHNINSKYYFLICCGFSALCKKYLRTLYVVELWAFFSLDRQVLRKDECIFKIVFKKKKKKKNKKRRPEIRDQLTHSIPAAHVDLFRPLSVRLSTNPAERVEMKEVSTTLSTPRLQNYYKGVEFNFVIL